MGLTLKIKGWEIPRSPICKLQAQESRWPSSSPILKACEPGQPEFKLRRWVSWLKQRTNLPSLHSFSSI